MKVNYILDTNIYRNLVRGKNIIDIQKKIISKNQDNTIFPIIVAIELINNLLENKKTSLNCFLALYYLTNNQNNNFNNLFLPNIYSLLPLFLFKEISKKQEVFNRNIITLSYEITNKGDYKNVQKFNSEILKVKQYKENEINQIVENLKYYLKTINGNQDINWNIFEENIILKREFEYLLKNDGLKEIFGLALIKMSMEETKVRYVKMPEILDNLLNNFSMSIDFFIEHILTKLLTIRNKEYIYKPALDPKKRWNSFYDFQLIMGFEYENHFGRKTIFVSEEKKIQTLFKKYEKENFFMNLDEYKRHLNLCN